MMIVNSKIDQMIVNEVAAKELKMAAKNFSEAEVDLKSAEFKYEKLVQFREDYVDRFDNEMKQYVAEDTHQGFRSFFSRLDVVIFEQQDIIANLKQKVKIQYQLLNECKNNSPFLEDEGVEEKALH